WRVGDPPLRGITMQRRDLLRLLGGTAAITGLSPDQLFGLGREVHRGISLGESADFFDTHQMHTVAAAADRIIPATDTPGAMATECHRFIERIVADHYDAARQRRFIEGLVDLDRRSSAAHRQLFVELDTAEQDAVLTAMEDAAYAAKPDGADSFWRDLKYLTIYGYYTSEIGIEEELQTNRFPGRFDGCVPVAEAG
ncbi:MAG TPA: gluconate 2-dehydrogenase subunit 3 family protein, partial [Gemmatimonadales bacterium]|nr:gluconate 2-dehydrogenase subunit 3 family protein [Gemmatimonadales bacterium]